MSLRIAVMSVSNIFTLAFLQIESMKDEPCSFFGVGLLMLALQLNLVALPLLWAAESALVLRCPCCGQQRMHWCCAALAVGSRVHWCCAALAARSRIHWCCAALAIGRRDRVHSCCAAFAVGSKECTGAALPLLWAAEMALVLRRPCCGQQRVHWCCAALAVGRRECTDAARHLLWAAESAQVLRCPCCGQQRVHWCCAALAVGSADLTFKIDASPVNP